MFSKVFRKRPAATEVEFCESCTPQVCTSECRAQSHFEQVRERATLHLPGVL